MKSNKNFDIILSKGYDVMRVNEKLMRITEDTIVVGIDIAKYKHYARFIDYRGNVIYKTISFDNNKCGFDKLIDAINIVKEKTGKGDVIIGCEPTGHYWFNLRDYLKEQQIELVIVSTYATKNAKEFDDNSPTKSDTKDALVIAKLVAEGRYSIPVIREGLFQEIHNGHSIIEDIDEEIVRVKNKIHRWNDIYFPEIENVYKIDSREYEEFAKLAMTPEVIKNTSLEVLTEKLRENNRYASKDKIAIIKTLAGISVGCEANDYAKKEIKRLIKRLRELTDEKEELQKELEIKASEIDYVKNIVEITGIGYGQMLTIISECGDLNNFSHYKQLMKMAGLGLKENSSGTKKGRKHINKRGRSQLRRILKLVALSLIKNNDAFKSLHEYYTQKRERCLEKIVSVNAIIHKFVRVMMAIVKSNEKFSKEKMIKESIINYS